MKRILYIIIVSLSFSIYAQNDTIILNIPDYDQNMLLDVNVYTFTDIYAGVYNIPCVETVFNFKNNSNVTLWCSGWNYNNFSNMLGVTVRISPFKN